VAAAWRAADPVCCGKSRRTVRAVSGALDREAEQDFILFQQLRRYTAILHAGGEPRRRPIGRPPVRSAGPGV